MKTLPKYAHYLLPILLILQPLQSKETYDLDGAIEKAISNNKELSYARLEIDRAKAKFRWSGRLPNPRLEFMGSSDQLGLNEGEHNLQIALAQSFPRTAVLNTETTLRFRQIALADAEVLTKEQALAARVAEDILKLVATRNYLKITREHIELDKAIIRSLKEFIARGEASRLELTQAELKLQHLNQQERGQISQIQQHRMHMHQLLGLPPESEATYTYQLDLPEEKPTSSLDQELILSNRGEYQIAQSEILASDSELDHEKARSKEPIQWKALLAEERIIDEPIGAERNTFVGVSVSIPLPFRQKNEERIEQAKINKRASEKALESLKFNIVSEYHAAQRFMTDNWDIAHIANGEILQMAKKSYNDYQLAYLDGQVSLLQVQRALEQLHELEEEALKASVLYHQSHIQLQKISGALRSPAKP